MTASQRAFLLRGSDAFDDFESLFVPVQATHSESNGTHNQRTASGRTRAGAVAGQGAASTDSTSAGTGASNATATLCGHKPPGSALLS